MSDLAIQVTGLGKCYRIGRGRETYGTLRDSLAFAVQSLVRRLRTGDPERPPTELWALRNVSFELKCGEVLGIIGRNGAGKSTLLKILARVTYPTQGRAEVLGRVGSLLEVGTGFHPELTGRENIFLNGAVLGMKRIEIQRKFDEIIDFAEIEPFLDTPVKRYSSGMYMRLAFAIAAHLEPEILVVDEVLAVGDAAFQKKCLGQMSHVAHEGRTVLFVSHNMSAIQSLCESVILLDRGQVVERGLPREMVQRYLKDESSLSTIPLDQRTNRDGDGSARIVSLRIESTEPDGLIRPSSRLKLTLHYQSDKPIHRPQFVVSIYDYMDIGIYLLHNDFVGGLPETLPACGSVTCVTDPINLTPGRCFVHLELLKGNARADYIPYAGNFDVISDDVFGSGMLPERDWVLGVLGHSWYLNDAGAAESEAKNASR